MVKYGCLICGYIYDSDGDSEEAGEKYDFADLPADWICPDCGADKEQFDPEE